MNKYWGIKNLKCLLTAIVCKAYMWIFFSFTTDTLRDRLHLPVIYRQETEALENLSNLPKFTHKVQCGTTPEPNYQMPIPKSWLCHCLVVWPWAWPQFHDNKSGHNNRTYFLGLLRWLNELIQVNHFEPALTHRKHSINVRSYLLLLFSR